METLEEKLVFLGYENDANGLDTYYRNTGNNNEVQIFHILRNLNKVVIGNYTTDITVDFESLLAIAELIKERLLIGGHHQNCTKEENNNDS